MKNEFESQLSTYTDRLNEINSVDSLKELLLTDFAKLVEYYIATANNVQNHSLNSENELAVEEVYLINYQLPEILKSIIILHRDVFLELNKASIYFHEKQTSEKEINVHFLSSKKILLEAIDSFNMTISKEKNDLQVNKKQIQKVRLKLSLQDNPWSIYRSQFEILLNQLNEIEKSKRSLIETIIVFDKLKAILASINKMNDTLFGKLSDGINHFINSVEKNTVLDKLVAFVDSQLIKNSLIESEHQTLLVEINKQINLLQKVVVPIASKEGFLSKRGLDFKTQSQKWFDYQILPELMDLASMKYSLIEKYNVSHLNSSNSLKLYKNNPKESYDRLLNSIHRLNEDINEQKNKVEKITSSVQTKVNSQLLVSDFIKGKPFLEVTLNSSMSIDGSTFLKKIRGLLYKGNKYFQEQYLKSKMYRSISNLELSLQCIAHRMYKDDSTHYDSLFLSKDFIGNLFLVSREEQEKKLVLIKEQWKKGFNKSVLIYGDRLSGRSTFLDYTSKKLFGKHIVVLKPNSSAIIDGRKFKTTFDLKEALSYVKNNNLKSTKPVVLIDDLELWRNSDHRFLDNVRALISFIETESEDVFIMISTTTMMLEHLNARMNFSNSISHVINLNEVGQQEIMNAILRRHDATNRVLVSEDLKPVSLKKIKETALKLTKRNHNNFGDTLQSWTYITFVQENEEVMLKDSYHEFLDFFSAPEIIVLKQALIFKTISEFGLKRATSLSYELEFKPAIRKLVNTKVLIRDLSGDLYINPVVVNDITNIVRSKTED